MIANEEKEAYHRKRAARPRSSKLAHYCIAQRRLSRTWNASEANKHHAAAALRR